jgi:CARDB
MRRALIISALAAAATTAAASAFAVPPPAAVKVVKCSFEDHEAAFHARMRLVDGATRMAMRFTLLEQTAADGAERLDAPGLRRWRSSKPGVGTFGFKQGFRNLPENASHRVRVSFRWYSADGEEVRRAKRRSALCHQFDELPNLVTRIARVAPSAVPGVMRYETTVTNSGEADAAAVPVRLTVDGDVVDTVTVASLARGEQRSLVIRGPRCRRLAKLEVDPEKAIAESSDEDNVHELSCAALMNAA